jgi:hypothetical protein
MLAAAGIGLQLFLRLCLRLWLHQRPLWRQLRLYLFLQPPQHQASQKERASPC